MNVVCQPFPIHHFYYFSKNQNDKTQNDPHTLGLVFSGLVS